MSWLWFLGGVASGVVATLLVVGLILSRGFRW